MTVVSRKQLLAYYKSKNQKPPKMVVDADPKTKFAFGFCVRNLVAGYAPLHRAKDEVFKVYDMISIVPLTDKECKDFLKPHKHSKKKGKK